MTRFKTNMDFIEESKAEFEAPAGRGKINYYKAHDGKNLIRILPPYSEEGRFYKTVGYHRIGSGMGRENKVVCPRVTFGEPCLVCSRGAKVMKARGKEAAEIYLPNKRALINVLDMLKADQVVYVQEMGPSLINPVLEFLSTMGDDTMLDPNAGYNIMFQKQGTGNRTRYKNLMVLPKPYDLEANGYDVETVLQNLNNLGSVPWKSDEEEMGDFAQRFFQYVAEQEQGGGSGDGGATDPEDEDYVPSPAARSGKPPQRAAAQVPDEEDDVPAAATEEEETAEETTQAAPAPAPAAKRAAATAVPKPAAKRAAPAPVVLDEEELPAEEEEEELTPPTPAPRAAAATKTAPKPAATTAKAPATATTTRTAAAPAATKTPPKRQASVIDEDDAVDIGEVDDLSGLDAVEAPPFGN